MHKFAVLIPAHNEATVIGSLIGSLKDQTYPAENIDIYVVADNCTDNTANIAREKHTTVYERNDRTKVSKGYALNFLFNKIDASHPKTYYDAYIIFDADNLAAKDFIEQIDKIYTEGFKIISPFRNSKNYDTNWLSATSSMYVIYQSNLFKHRFKRGSDCAVLGTGFLVDREVIEKYHNWDFFTLGEDTEFSMCAKQDGIKIGYADDAIIYDEQPTSLKDFWNQRLRWVRGHLQVMKLYKNSPTLSGIDPLAIATCLTFLSLVLIMLVFIASLIWHFAAWPYLLLLTALAYLPTYLVGLYTVITEHKRIHAKTHKIIIYTFFFPVMIFLFILASVVAFFSRHRTTWNTIPHSNKTIAEVEQS